MKKWRGIKNAVGEYQLATSKGYPACVMINLKTKYIYCFTGSREGLADEDCIINATQLLQAKDLPTNMSNILLLIDEYEQEQER